MPLKNRQKHQAESVVQSTNNVTPGNQKPAPWRGIARTAAIVCPLVSATLLLEIIFQWDLVELLTPFIEPGVVGLTWLAFCVTSLLAFFVLVCARGAKPLDRILPMASTAVTLALVLTVDFTNLMLDFDFKYNVGNRQKCVAELLATPGKVDGIVKLPTTFGFLSKGGGEVEVIRNRTNRSVLFFTYRGVLDNYSGFLYSEDGSTPSTGKGPDEYNQVRKLQDHWFFVAHW